MRIKNLFAAFILVSSVVASSLTGVIGGIPSAHAAGATRTWIGGGADNKLSNTSNWQGGVAPQAGDIINFTSAAGITTTIPNYSSQVAVNLVNDLGFSLAGVTTSAISDATRIIHLDTLSLSDGANVNVGMGSNGEQLIFRFDHIVSSGQVTLNNAYVEDITAPDVTIAGPEGSVVMGGTITNLTVASDSQLTADVRQTWMLSGVTNIIIQKNAMVSICGVVKTEGEARTINSNFIFGGGTGSNPRIVISPCIGAVGSTYVAPTAAANFTGTFILNDNASISTLNSPVSFSSTLTTNGNVLSVRVGENSAILGSGVMGYVTVDKNGIIAPGYSPGLLTVNGLTQNGTYQAQIGGLNAGTEYDQIKVIGSVELAGSLEVSLYGGYVPQIGSAFTIIENDGSDAVIGSFANMAEGSTFAAEGITYKISYVGGDGNDIVITAVNPVNAPNTGIEKLIQSNPAVVAAALGALVIGFALITRAKRTVRR